MNPITGIAIIAGILYLAYNQGAFTQFGMAPPNNQPAYPPPQPPNNTFGLTPGIGSGFSGAIQQEMPSNTASVAVNQGAAVAGSAAVLSKVGVAASAIPIVGVAVSIAASIASALLGAHNARIKQARDENSAMNLGVQGYDQGLAQVNAAYNARQIDASQAIGFVRQIFANYWAEVSPHIQPGRNGCSNGSSCPPWPAGGNGCSGNIGAACCVGCYDLAGDSNPHVFSVTDGGDGSTPLYYGAAGTIAALQRGGAVVLYQKVYGSKYGGQERAAYRLSWSQISHA